MVVVGRIAEISVREAAPEPDAIGPAQAHPPLAVAGAAAYVSYHVVGAGFEAEPSRSSPPVETGKGDLVGSRGSGPALSGLKGEGGGHAVGEELGVDLVQSDAQGAEGDAVRAQDGRPDLRDAQAEAL